MGEGGKECVREGPELTCDTVKCHYVGVRGEGISRVEGLGVRGEL